MTTNREKATEEIKATLKWFSDETKKINDELDEQQGVERRIDGNREAFAEMHKEFVRRMAVIGEKYNLPRTQNAD